MHTMIPNKEAVLSGDFIFFGGITSKDRNDHFIYSHDVSGQTETIIRRMNAYLRSVDLGLENIVSVTVFLTDIRHYDQMNVIYAQLMPESLPPRKVIVGPLTIEGAVVEMTAIASRSAKIVLIPDF